MSGIIFMNKSSGTFDQRFGLVQKHLSNCGLNSSFQSHEISILWSTTHTIKALTKLDNGIIQDLLLLNFHLEY